MESNSEVSLEMLKQKLLTMASHAETAVNEALQALQTRDTDLALRVKEKDRVIDHLEVESEPDGFIERASALAAGRRQDTLRDHVRAHQFD